MKLQRVISGGQTGADRTGLECARELGLETGGRVPQGWRTDSGSDPSLADFGCIEDESPEYPPRTAQNVLDADATIWFGNFQSPGGRLTKKICKLLRKPFIANPTDLRTIANEYRVLNVAGNRERTNPEVVQLVRQAFATLKKSGKTYG